jgi:hypothetical protein
MVNFQIAPNLYDELPQTLLQSVSGFRDSPEFQKIAEFVNLPGIVSASLGRYIARLEREEDIGKVDPQRKERLESAYAALEGMAKSPDSEVVNALCVEILWYLSDGSPLWEKIESKLKPECKNVLRDWPLSRL